MADQQHAPPQLGALADAFFEHEAMAALEHYTTIPCLSPQFDPEWASSGHIDAAAELLRAWAATRPIARLEVQIRRLPGLTPVIVAEVPASTGWEGEGTVVLYGHLDKQPPLGEWRDGLGPYTPVRDGDRFYGRGTADDGYSTFAAFGAIEILERAGIDHGRCIVLIEASEESGSPHLPAYLDALGDELGAGGPALVVCLDSGCLTYDRLWTTTSLRGLVDATIRVDVLAEGVHSGAAGGVVPSSFRILRQLLSRIEDEETGEVLLPECNAEVPAQRRQEAVELAGALGEAAIDEFPTLPDLQRSGATTVERILARTWAPSVAFVGIDGVPPVRDGGNVLRPFTTGKIAMRLPPSADANQAAEAVRRALTEDPPDGARVAVVVEGAGGFDAPETAEWLTEATQAASFAYFSAPAGAMGEGGTIPFLHELLVKYPGAQFLVTGVLGPESNAHGVNEMLHLPTAKRVTASVAHVLSQAGVTRRSATRSSSA
jgi:acetylornithine deacetylase/succinyl-diaminopimelate desuccinylase-like protein